MAKRHKKIKRTKVEQLNIDLNKWLVKRDTAITLLVRAMSKLHDLRRAGVRLDKRKPVDREDDVKLVFREANPRVAKAVDEGIPDFLLRSKEADARDRAAREAIKAEQEDQKKNKARVRIEKLKAKQAGDLKRMPLSGRDALAAIRNG